MEKRANHIFTGLAFLLFLFNSSFVFGQVKLDSLFVVLRKSSPDTARVKVLNKISEGYLKLGDPEQVIVYADSAIFLSDELGFESGKALANYNRARGYFYIGDYRKASDLAFEALKGFEKMKKENYYAGVYNTIGGIFQVQKNFTKAGEFYLRAFELKQLYRDTAGIAVILGNISVIYLESGRLDSALIMSKKALEFSLRMNDEFSISKNHQSVGNIYWSRKEYSEALQHHLKALELQTRLGNLEGVSECYTNLGGVFLDLGKYKEALEHERRAIALAREIPSPHILVSAYQLITETFLKVGNKDSAIHFLKLQMRLKDSIFSAETSARVAQNELQYRVEKEERERELVHKALEEKQNALLEKQRSVIIAVITVAGLIFIFLAIYIRAFRQKKKANIEISLQKEIIENKNKAITDSINYAMRIQKSLFPTEKYIEKKLKKLKRQ